ncbi:MAG TPA: M23 family metallopeptidase [Opitutaceae bacterium]|nr:M23 family metallopeptidase [Opitutaceae bacterium]
MRKNLLLIAWLVGAVAASATERLQLVWPTPNRAWAEGKPLGAYVQDTGLGNPESGTFGGVRTDGRQFHEGIDMKCVERDRHGEPLDHIFAAMDGVVRHINAVAGASNYGRYIVLEHPEQSPAVYTLYAHLARIAPGLRVGERVGRGQMIGIMGHSSDRPIPRVRAHMHFEIGVLVTRDFQRWYDWKRFGSRNEQGIWNGMNLMGIDPLAVFNEWRAGRIATMQDVFAHMVPEVRLRIATRRVPDFVERYPSLLTKPLPMGPVSGWEISCNWTGLPFAWTPLTAEDVIALAPGEVRITDVNSELERRERSKILVVRRRGRWVPGRDLEEVLQQLFEIR